MEDTPNRDAEYSSETQDTHLRYPRSVVFGVLTLSSLALLVMSWQVKTRLTVVFPRYGSGENPSESLATSVLELEDEQLRRQDSDEDGLTDYQELRVYGSSPFIADTDSDGISDREEVESGADPNCAQGQNCLAGISFAPQELGFDSILQSGELQAIINNPEEIRRLLVQKGASRDVVNRIDDQSLQILAQQALEEFSRPTEESLDALRQVPPEQLRSILIQAGVPQQDLSGLTDEELYALFQEIIDRESATLDAQADESIDQESTEE